jgi:hypothetical protein
MKRANGGELSEFDEETERLERQRVTFAMWIGDMKADRDGAGFVVDPDPELKVIKLERDDGRALDLATGDVVTSSYVPREEALEVGQWCFQLEDANRPLKLAHHPLKEANRTSKESH